MPVIELLATLPSFLIYLMVALMLLAVFLIVYTRLTQHPEWQLIRDGNVAAATALSGAMLGFALPLASAIAHSVSLRDMVLWAGVALLVQWGAYLTARKLLPGQPSRIERGDMAAAVTTAAIALTAGLLNAACMTY